MASASKLDQIVKGAAPPKGGGARTPRPPSILAGHGSHGNQGSSSSSSSSRRSRPAGPTSDPLHSLPSSPPQIYLNLLILEASLRAQYLTLRARRRQYTFFLALLSGWLGYFVYALFLAPREDGRGVGGSVYWVVEMAEKVALMGGLVTALLVWGTGQWERGIRWPRRWLAVANRGLRIVNAKVVLTKGGWWSELGALLAALRAWSSAAWAAGAPSSSAAAAAATGIGGPFGDYAGNLAADRAATAARMQADPSREMVGQLAGGALLPVGAANKALQGATLGTKLTRGALAGAGIGAVQGASSSADLGNIPQAALSTAIGAGTGAGFGLAAPLVGAGAGATARRLLGQTVPAVTGPSGPIQTPAQKYLMDAIQADGPGAIWQGTQQLGDQGMFADYGNNLRGIAQGLAIKPGAAGQNVVQALEARNAGVNTRLGQSVGQNLGPVTSPMTHGASVDAAIQPYAQAQQQALKEAGPVDISGVYKQLQDALPNAAPGTDEHKALSGAISSLTASGEGATAVPTTSAQVIDSARKGLDDALYPAVPGGQVSSAMRDQLGAYQMARQGISKALKDQIPAYKDATEAIAQVAPMRGAYNDGLGDLTRDVAHYPPDYQQTFNGLAPQVQDSRAAGLRMAVEQAVGTKENDLQALRNATQGANGWNAQNLGHVFGQGPVDSVNRDIAGELRMRDTFGKVTQNAETARRTAMAKALADSESKPWEIGETHNVTLHGIGLTIAKQPVNALLRAFQPGIDNGARDLQLGQAITAQGDPRNQIMAQLLRAHAVRQANDALSAPADRAVTTLTALSPAALAHALRNYREPAR
ncbi:MAG: hypothetical protein M1826_003317 [Phylliscum demangeonii]|nr:MAG: hypothetical protein M1826_003317 [Phylliscum demangeonii]